MPTKFQQGSRDGDSDDWFAESDGLTKNGESDLTLDFGFVEGKPEVTVGDRIWFDDNANGIQDKGESGIEGVVVIVKDPEGKVVGEATTDENGNYLFEHLPVLDEGQKYTVEIDREKSKDALAGLKPTTEGAGGRDEDSSTWSADSEAMDRPAAEDLSLDFGFVKSGDEPSDEPDSSDEPSDEPAPSKDSDGSEAPSEDDDLADTGSALAAPLAGLAVLLLVGGAVVMIARRRGRHS